MLLAVSESLKRRYDFESWRLATEPFVPRASLGGVPEFGDEYRAVCVDDGRLAEERFRATYGPSLRAFYDRGGVVVVLSSSAALAVPRDCLSPIFGCAWSYAAGSPRDDYVPTRAGARRLGLDGAATLACAKATLLAVGAGEALLVPRRLTASELGMTAAEYAAYDPPAGDHTPLALKANDVGGQVAYVGFDNDDPALARLVADLACGVPARTTTR